MHSPGLASKLRGGPLDKKRPPVHSGRMNLELFFCALGLALFLEGLFYAICATKLPSMFSFMAAQRPSALRAGGFVAMLAGIGLIALIRL